MLKLLDIILSFFSPLDRDDGMVRSLRGEPTEYVAPVSVQIAAHYDGRANFRRCSLADLKQYGGQDRLAGFGK